MATISVAVHTRIYLVCRVGGVRAGSGAGTVASWASQARSDTATIPVAVHTGICFVQ